MVLVTCVDVSVTELSHVLQRPRLLAEPPIRLIGKHQHVMIAGFRDVNVSDFHVFSRFEVLLVAHGITLEALPVTVLNPRYQPC